VHREVAKLFLQKPSVKQKYVLHLNHNKVDNTLKNLRWANLQDMIAHQQNSPAKIAYKKIQSSRVVGLKLKADQVKNIKKLLQDPKRKMTIKALAEKYRVSEMTIYRIKSGENWSQVKKG
jgi:hypothetical protein